MRGARVIRAWCAAVRRQMGRRPRGQRAATRLERAKILDWTERVRLALERARDMELEKRECPMRRADPAASMKETAQGRDEDGQAL